MRRRLHEGVDIVIGTPGKVAAYREQRLLFVSKLSYLVLDEADTLLNPEHGFLSGSKGVETLLTALRSVRSKHGPMSKSRRDEIARLQESKGGEEKCATAEMDEKGKCEAVDAGTSRTWYM